MKKLNKGADYFISLIGTNPLPVLITVLKNCNKDTKIFLVHTVKSENNIGTEKVAHNLANVIFERIPEVDIKFLPCDKSDTRKIESCVNQLIEDIQKEELEHKKRLVLDYSSGTKAMSAIFAERLFNTKKYNLDIIISYVDDNTRKILEDSNNIGENKRFSIKDIVNSLNLSIEEIVKIHGYNFNNPELKEKVLKGNIKYIESKEPIIFINDMGNKISVDGIYLLNGRMIICFESQYRSKGKGKYKFELFQIKDISDKLGGNRSGIIYKSDCDEGMVSNLKKDLKRSYEYEMEERLNFIYINETFEEQIKKKYLEEGGN